MEGRGAVRGMVYRVTKTEGKIGERSLPAKVILDKLYNDGI